MSRGAPLPYYWYRQWILITPLAEQCTETKIYTSVVNLGGGFFSEEIQITSPAQLHDVTHPESPTSSELLTH